MTSDTLQKTDNAQATVRRGFFLAFAAYFCWGLLPFYMKGVAHLPLMEVVAHRVLWSVPIAAGFLIWQGRTADFKAALRSPHMLGMAALTAIVISINWSIYVWAIAVDRTLETALGYYINPLVNVILGALVLSERLNRVQICAVSLAAIAVIMLTYENGSLPWVSLSLAISFGCYSFLRKTLPIGPSQGFLLEIVILAIPAAAYIAWLIANGNDHILSGTWLDVALLVGCGPITAVPLLMFAYGAKALRLSTLGLMQYFAPTMLFLIAVFVFGEPFGASQLIAFTLIWTGLVIYTWSSLRGK